MSSSLSRVIMRIAVPAIALGAVVALAPTASAVTTPTPVGPGQRFVGVVNGALDHATIRLGCFGPGARVGHPLPRQFVEARLAAPFPNTPVGATGEAATSLTVSLLVRQPLGQLERFPIGSIDTYGTRVPIQETLTLPCAAAGRVVFVPTPAGAGARTAHVRVTLVGQF